MGKARALYTSGAKGCTSEPKYILHSYMGHSLNSLNGVI